MLTNIRKNNLFIKYLITYAFLLIATVCNASNIFNNVGGSLYFDNAGQLSPLSPPFVTGSGEADNISVSPDGSLVFAVHYDSNITQYKVDINGQLLALATPIIPSRGTSKVVLTPNGKFAYLVGQLSNTISLFNMDPTSGLSPFIPPTMPTGDVSPEEIVITPNGKFAYVTSDGLILQYSIDPISGKLSPLTPAAIRTVSTRVIDISPDGRFAYVGFSSRGSSSGIQQFSIGTDGQLSLLSQFTVLTSDEPWSLARTPDNKFLYVIVFGKSGVIQYSIDPVSGKLIFLATAPTSATPENIAITPSGKFAYVSDIGAGIVAQYSIDINGQLNLLTPASIVMPWPTAITITPDNQYTYITNQDGSIYQFRIKVSQ
jgi:6-phosphogluconolactonase (cycloisomerase 2 family)